MIKYKSGLNLANLKNVIKQAGMQSKDVADQLGVRPETVSRWINGGAVPGFDQAEHLAEILNVSVSDIMFRNRGLLIAGTRDFHGNVTMYDSLEPKIFASTRRRYTRTSVLFKSNYTFTRRSTQL